MTYKMIQVSNLPTAPLGAVATGGALFPLGVITHRIGCGTCSQPTFTVQTSGANTVTVNDCGYYRVTFGANVVATDAGLVTLNLVQNGAIVYSVSETAVAGETVNLGFTFIVRATPNYGVGLPTMPANLQITNTGVALTGGTSNLIVERIY